MRVETYPLPTRVSKITTFGIALLFNIIVLLIWPPHDWDSGLVRVMFGMGGFWFGLVMIGAWGLRYLLKNSPNTPD